MYVRSAVRLAFALLLFATNCHSQQDASSGIQEIRTITVGPKQSSWSLTELSFQFKGQALAISPSSDFLMFSPRRDGAWELVRVQNWSGPVPTVGRLSLPGYYSNADRHDLDRLNAGVFVTPDGHYAACTGTAEWIHYVHGKTVGPRRTQSVLTVIDLTSFKPVKTLRTSALTLLEFHSVWMDPLGRIVITTRDFGPDNKHSVVQLAIPSLEVQAKCNYVAATEADRPALPIPSDEEACSKLTAGAPLDDYLKQEPLITPSPVAADYVCGDPALEYCPEPDTFTSDHRIGMGIETEGHDTLLGGWTETRAVAVFFSTSSKREFARLDVTHRAGYIRLVAANRQDYLLTLRDGSVLTVYSLLSGVP